MLNKNSLLLVIFFILFYHVVYSQVQNYVEITGQVVNISHKPIQNVNVVSILTSKTTFSDIEGNFKIKVLNTDTILFTAIAYKNKKVAASQLAVTSNTIIMDSMIYSISQVNVMEFRWKELEYTMMHHQLAPTEQKILVIKGLPNPYTVLEPIKPNIVMNPISAIYEFFKAENVRKRKQARWNDTYNDTWIKNEKK